MPKLITRAQLAKRLNESRECIDARINKKYGTWSDFPDPVSRVGREHKYNEEDVMFYVESKIKQAQVTKNNKGRINLGVFVYDANTVMMLNFLGMAPTC